MNEEREAVFVTFNNMFELTRLAVKRTQEHGIGDALVSIVFSIAAIESFINDLQMLAQFFCSHKKTPGVLMILANVLDELEESHASIPIKYQMARIILIGEAFNKGEQPFQDFTLLLKLRNALVHAGPDRVVEIGPNKFQPNKYHGLISQLADRGLCDNPTQPLSPWTDYIDSSPKVARWSYNSALAMTQALFSCIPDSLVKMILREMPKEIMEDD